jgi:hypothetical protein
VEEAFGIDPAALNDDRIARALDAIAPELDRIVGSVGAQAIAVFGLDVSRCHWDMTSISLYGAYEHTEDEFATPRFGHPKDRRPDLKQVQAGLAVTGDGGVPVFHRAYDGGAGEIAQVVGAMTALRQTAGPRQFLLVGDSKLVSPINLSAMIAAGVGFVAPASEDLRARHCAGRPRPEHRGRGRLPRRTRHRQTRRHAGPVAGGRGHDDRVRTPQEGSGVDAAAGVRALQRPRARRRHGPGQEAGPGPRGSGPADPLAGVAALPQRAGGHRASPRSAVPAVSPPTCAPRPAPTWRPGNPP